MSFIEATRQNIRPLTTMSYESGIEKSYDISRVGFLSKVTLRFKGKLTAKHASKTTFAKAEGAPYNLANRIKLVLNNGVSVWDASGVGTYWQNILTRCNYRMDEEIAGSKVFAFGNKVSASGAENDIQFSLDLNVSINDLDLVGLLLLQSSQVVASVKIDSAAPGVLATDTDIEFSLTGNWYISVEYFDVPSNNADWPNLATVHQVLENQDPITSTGANRFTIPRGNIYMRLINGILLNGAYNDEDIEKLTIKYNLSNEPYNIDADDMLALQRNRYGRDMPKGVFVWDFYYQGHPNMGSHRDFVYSGNITEFDQYIHIANSASLGSNNNKLITVREMLVDVRPA